MQGKHLYEYAVIRLVPKVEREEFFNVGIILFSKRAKYIKALYKVDENKLNLFSSELDRESLFANLHVFDKICSGTKEGGPIAALDVPERFRWLTAVRSASIQTSRPHPGFSDDLDQTLEILFRELVFRQSRRNHKRSPAGNVSSDRYDCGWIWRTRYRSQCSGKRND